MRPKLNGRRCLCRTCGERFNSTFAFDAHREGKYDIRQPGYGRRCLTPDEMRARGFDVNAAGFWISSTREGNSHRSDDQPEAGTGVAALPHASHRCATQANPIDADAQ